MPKNFQSSRNLKKTGIAGIFAACLELAKEGNIKVKQEDLFKNIYIKQQL